MITTCGINHLGLAVRQLEPTRDFFVNLLGWTESGYDAIYPRTAVTDGVVRLTLWQVDQSQEITAFDRRKNVGLHHLALEVQSEEQLYSLCQRVQEWPGVEIEFPPEPVGAGPRQHMMCYEPGGIRVEFIWPGS